MGWFLLYLFAALQVAACLIAVVARSWKLTPEPIVWRGTDVDVASNNVQQFLIDIDDSRFAYPTGMFVPDPSSAPSAGRVVMREDNFTGSRGLGWALRVFATFHEVWRRQMARDQHLITYLAWPLWMMIAAFLSAPFLLAAILDIGYRIAFRSQITADIAKHPDLDDAVNIRLGFRGLSAFGLVPDALRGMTAPVLPTGLVTTDTPDLASDTETRTLAVVGGRAAAWAQSAEQRFRVIYGSAIGAAVAVALLLALFVQHGPDYGYDSSLASSESSGGYESQNSGSTSSGGTSEDSGADSSTDTTSPDEDSSTDTTASSADNASASVFTARDGYTVEPPDGWIRNSDSKDKGSYNESRWHLAGVSGVYVIINHTAGYDGTALQGATTVRNSAKKAADYTEYEWGRIDDDTWQWEFALNGSRKMYGGFLRSAQQ